MNFFREDMENILAYCEGIEDTKHRNKFIHLLHWVQNEFKLVPCFEWRTPIFADNNLIVGFFAAKDGIQVFVDGKIMDKYYDEISGNKYKCEDKSLIIKWNQKIDFDLLTKIICFEKEDSRPCKTLPEAFPLKIDFSHDSWPMGIGHANFSVKYDSNLNAYVGESRWGKCTINANKMLKIIEKYDMCNWKQDFYSFSDEEMQILDGSWWHLNITYDYFKFSNKGGCEFGPKFLDSFETEMINLLLWNSDDKASKMDKWLRNKTENLENHKKFISMLDKIQLEFELNIRPFFDKMAFAENDRFIISFQEHKNYFSIMIENDALKVFKDDFIKRGYIIDNNECYIKWTQDVNFDLLRKVIKYKKTEKRECPGFWKNMPLKIIVNYNTPFPARNGLYIEIDYDDKFDTYAGNIRTQYGKYNIRIDASEIIYLLERTRVTKWKTNYMQEKSAADDNHWEVIINYETDKLISEGDSTHHPKKFHHFKDDFLKLAESNIISTEISYFFENPHAALLFTMIDDKLS